MAKMNLNYSTRETRAVTASQQVTSNSHRTFHAQNEEHDDDIGDMIKSPVDIEFKKLGIVFKFEEKEGQREYYYKISEILNIFLTFM